MPRPFILLICVALLSPLRGSAQDLPPIPVPNPAMAPPSSKPYLLPPLPISYPPNPPGWPNVHPFGTAHPGMGPQVVTRGLPGENRDKLRKLVDFPGMIVNFGLGHNQNQIEHRNGQGVLIEPAKKIEKCLAKLNGSVSDAETYLELAGFYSELKQKEKAQEMGRHAEKLLRPFLNTSDPKEASRLLEYAEAHGIVNPQRWKEQEAWIRRAVELAPKDWQARQRLGRWSVYCAQAIVLGDRHYDNGGHLAMVKALLASQTPPDDLTEVEKRLVEARQCCDLAKQFAPTNEELRHGRIGFLLQELDYQAALRVARGGIMTRDFPLGGQFNLETRPDLVAEMQEAARLCPDHIGTQVFGFMALLAQLKKKVENDDYRNGKAALGLSPQEKQMIDETVARFEKIAKNAGPESSLFCLRSLCVIQFKLALLTEGRNGLAKGESFVRRIVEADPKDQTAAEMLLGILHEQYRDKESLEIAQRLMARNPSGRNRYILAKCHHQLGQLEAAAKELDAGIKQDPADPYCLTGRAVLLIRAGDDSMLEASKLLDRARAALKSGVAFDIAEGFELADAILWGLMAQEETARHRLEVLRKNNPHEPRFGQALELLRPTPVMPVGGFTPPTPLPAFPPPPFSRLPR